MAISIDLVALFIAAATALLVVGIKFGALAHLREDVQEIKAKIDKLTEEIMRLWERK